MGEFLLLKKWQLFWFNWLEEQLIGLVKHEIDQCFIIEIFKANIWAYETKDNAEELCDKR